MPKSPFDDPPLVESTEDFREYILKLHDDVYGLGDDITGSLNVADNLDVDIVDANEDVTITGEWTFDTHPLGLDHLLIANIGTNTHGQIDTHIADNTVHFTEASIDHSAIDELEWSVAGHTIDTDFLPDTDDAYDLGSESFQWSNLYLAKSLFIKGSFCVISKVNEAGGITIGDEVYISGATGDKPRVSLADNTVHDKAHTFGMAAETKVNGENICIAIAGEVRGVDTSGLTEGDRLHLTTAGQWQVAVPTSGAHLHVGRVSKVNVSTGIIEVIVDEYVHDIRGVDDQQVEIACGDDDITGFIDFQDYSRNSLGKIYGTGDFVWAGSVMIGSTDAPDNDLHIKKTGAANVRIESENVVGNVGLRLKNATQHWNFQLQGDAGGNEAHRFSVRNVTALTNPFSIEIGALDNTFYLNSTGVGVHTNAPVSGFHVDSTETEALIVTKNADGGDVFIVDTTNNTIEIPNDNYKLQLGATLTDLEIYSDGTDGRIDTNGILKINSSTEFVSKSKMTAIGGFAVALTNKTGANSVAGNFVIASVGTADAVDAAGVNELMPIGVFLDSGIADGSETWIVVSGIADVHMDAGGCALGDRIVTSATAGRGAVNNAPSVAIHFQEVGHVIEVAAANANARCILHFL